MYTYTHTPRSAQPLRGQSVCGWGIMKNSNEKARRRNKQSRPPALPSLGLITKTTAREQGENVCALAKYFSRLNNFCVVAFSQWRARDYYSPLTAGPSRGSCNFHGITRQRAEPTGALIASRDSRSSREAVDVGTFCCCRWLERLVIFRIARSFAKFSRWIPFDSLSPAGQGTHILK